MRKSRSCLSKREKIRVFCFFFFRESHGFAFARGTVVLSRELRPCLSETEKKRVFCFFFFPRESSFCFHERHGCDFARGMGVPLSKRKKTVLLVRFIRPVFSSGFFCGKKVRQNLSTWDLVLKISTRGIQRWKRFEIWTLSDKTFWINRSTKKRENSQVATNGTYATRHLLQLEEVGVIFATSTPQLVISSK